jgi:hypothetical protein
MEFTKNQLLKDEQGTDLIVLDTTEDFAFLCPIDIEKGIIDAAGVRCYSRKEGDSPIVTIELPKKEEKNEEV